MENVVKRPLKEYMSVLSVAFGALSWLLACFYGGNFSFAAVMICAVLGIVSGYKGVKGSEKKTRKRRLAVLGLVLNISCLLLAVVMFVCAMLIVMAL